MEKTVLRLTEIVSGLRIHWVRIFKENVERVKFLEAAKNRHGSSNSCPGSGRPCTVHTAENMICL